MLKVYFICGVSIIIWLRFFNCNCILISRLKPGCIITVKYKKSDTEKFFINNFSPTK